MSRILPGIGASTVCPPADGAAAGAGAGAGAGAAFGAGAAAGAGAAFGAGAAARIGAGALTCAPLSSGLYSSTLSISTSYFFPFNVATYFMLFTTSFPFSAF